LALEQLVLFYGDRNALLYILNFVRLHGAAELVDQSPASVSELLGVVSASRNQ
jgi:hypothetical protein